MLATLSEFIDRFQNDACQLVKEEICIKQKKYNYLKITSPVFGRVIMICDHGFRRYPCVSIYFTRMGQCCTILSVVNLNPTTLQALTKRLSKMCLVVKISLKDNNMLDSIKNWPIKR